MLIFKPLLLLLPVLILTGCGQSLTSPEPVEQAAQPATQAQQPAAVRAFDAELADRLGAVRIWTALPIPGRVTVRWRAYEPVAAAWWWVDEQVVDVPPSGEVIVRPGSGTTVLCRQYTVELVGQGWHASDWALCCPRYPCPVD